MNDEPAVGEDEAAVEMPQPPPPASPMTRAERIFVRINIVQTVLAVAGVFTGAVALYAALNESAAVRRQSEAAVWPILQLMVSDYANETGAEFRVSLSNTGVGPGRVRSMRVRVDGAAARNWRHVADLAVGDPDLPISKSYAIGRVIAAGDTVDLFAVSDRKAVHMLNERAASGAAQIDYCYCSIFDACWLVEDGGEAERVQSCPDYRADAFQE